MIHLRMTYLITLVCMTATLAFAAAEDVAKHPSCKHCGMDREKFSHSRVLINFDDGSSSGLCSLRCAAVELTLNIDKTPQTVMVGDYNSKMLIDAEKAFWVIGGSRKGVMTQTAKWAFAQNTDAENFIKENGGSLANFDGAIKAAYADMYEDTKLIRERRKMKKQQHAEPKSM